MNIVELLAFVVKNKASDLHLSAGMPPLIRVHGENQDGLICPRWITKKCMTWCMTS